MANQANILNYRGAFLLGLGPKAPHSYPIAIQHMANQLGQMLAKSNTMQEYGPIAYNHLHLAYLMQLPLPANAQEQQKHFRLIAHHANIMASKAGALFAEQAQKQQKRMARKANKANYWHKHPKHLA